MIFSKIRVSSTRFLTCCFLLTIAFAFTVNGQSKTDNKNARVIYISSAPRTANKTVRPRIRFIKRHNPATGQLVSLRKLRGTPFQLEKKAFNLINQERTAKGKPRLLWSARIAKLAREHSENMARHSFFSHTGLNGRRIDRRANDFGLTGWRSIGENIAYNKGFSNPSEFAVKRWMISDGHRVNLLNSRWKESGIGVAVTEDGVYFFTQIFMVR